MHPSQHRAALVIDTSCAITSKSCSVCHDTLRELVSKAQEPRSLDMWELSTHGFDLYPDLPRLRHWGERGCGLCLKLRQAALSTEARNVVSGWAVTSPCVVHIKSMLQKDERDPGSITRLRLVFSFTGFSEPPSLIDLSLQASATLCVNFPVVQHRWPDVLQATSPSALLPLGPLTNAISRVAIDPRAMEFVNGCIQKCRSDCSHADFFKDGASAFIPNRLLDVQNEQLKVVQGASLREAHPNGVLYLTLSYTWGRNTRQLMLDRSRESLLTTGFGFELLAPVQKDMVLVARALSIPYIWIDALCIVQGDFDDWVRESSLMHRIYSEAYITICAVASENCQEGFLERDETEVSLPILDAKSDTLIAKTLPYCVQTMPEVAKFSASQLSYSLLYTAWARRAWTFQEDALSKRCLYFTKSGTHFRCHNFTWMEYSKEPSSNDNVRSPPEFYHLRRGDFENARSLDDLSKAWLDVMYHYSSREITKQSDRLPALSALARRFEASYGSGNYVAGIWIRNMHMWLMWTSINGVTCVFPSFAAMLENLQDQKPYIAPSWSWVGCGQTVQMKPNHFTEALPSPRDAEKEKDHGILITRKLEVSCKPATADPYGQLASPSILTLETKTFPLENQALGLLELFIPPEHSGATDRSSLVKLHLGSQGGPVITLDLDWQYVHGEETVKWLTLALIGFHTSRDWSSRNGAPPFVNRWPYGLVLYREPNSGPYVRVGIFSVHDDDIRRLGISWTYKNFFYWCKTETIQIV